MENAESTRQWWYYVGLGLLSGVGVTSYLLLAPSTWSIVVLVLAGLLVTAMERLTRPPKPLGFTRPQPAYALVTIAGIVVALTLAFVSRALVVDQGHTWVAWVTGLVFFAVMAASRFLPASLR